MFLLVRKGNLKMGKIKQLKFHDYRETISETTYGGAPSCDNAKDFLEAIVQQLRELDKVEINNLLNSLLSAAIIIRVV